MLVSQVAARRAMLGGSFVISARRWRTDPKVGLIAPVIIVRGKRYHRKADIKDFVDRLVEATESGAATASARRSPRGRSRSGRASAGGRRDGMTLDSTRAGPARRRTSPRSSELLRRRLRLKNTADRRPSQAPRREALRSAGLLYPPLPGAGQGPGPARSWRRRHERPLRHPRRGPKPRRAAETVGRRTRRPLPGLRRQGSLQRKRQKAASEL